MTRATRFAAYMAPLIIYYLLTLLGIVNIPFMSQESSDALVPVVSLAVFLLRHIQDADEDQMDAENSYRSGCSSLSAPTP